MRTCTDNHKGHKVHKGKRDLTFSVDSGTRVRFLVIGLPARGSVAPIF